MIHPQVSDALLSQCDLASSFASMFGMPVEDGAFPDSEDHLDALLGRSMEGRKELMYESESKAKVLRRGKWEYLEPSEGPAIEPHTNIELGNSPEGQLYNMMYDIGQRENVAERYPEVAKEMAVGIAEILESRQTRQ